MQQQVLSSGAAGGCSASGQTCRFQAVLPRFVSICRIAVSSTTQPLRSLHDEKQFQLRRTPAAQVGMHGGLFGPRTSCMQKEKDILS